MSGDPYPKSSWSRQPGARSGATLTCKHCGGEFYVTAPWLDKHYPERAYGIEYRR